MKIARHGIVAVLKALIFVSLPNIHHIVHVIFTLRHMHCVLQDLKMSVSSGAYAKALLVVANNYGEIL